MIDKRIIAEPGTHYGSPRASTRHFIWQRVTGALNIVFLGFFIWLVLRLAGTDRAEMVGVIANPLVGVPLILLILSVVVHMRIGMREVIEDYIDDERLNHLTLLLNTAFGGVIAVIGIGAIVKIMFWG